MLNAITRGGIRFTSEKKEKERESEREREGEKEGETERERQTDRERERTMVYVAKKKVLKFSNHIFNTIFLTQY